MVIRRLRCRACNKIHHELPDILIPYKRHCAETIEKIIAAKAEESPCEESTIRRIKAWWAALLPYLIHVLQSLDAKSQLAFGDICAPKEMVRAVVNTNHWIHTRSACCPG